LNFLSVENIYKRFGDREIIRNISFGLNKGDKMALIAKNGTGKTTLLRMMQGLESPDSGRIVYRKDIKVRFLEQDPVFTPGQSVREAVFALESPLMRAISNYEEALEAQDSEGIQAGLSYIEQHNAWDYEARIQAILSRLQIHHYHQKVDTLSGGQRKRVALARVLIDQPDVIVLDEPTNHLDLTMIEWLENELSDEKLTLLMVTHDRYFLENVCNQIIELDNFILYPYRGNYDYYLEKRSERLSGKQSEIDKAKNIYRTELEWVRRMPKARGTKSKARLDSFDEIKAVAKQRIRDEELSIEVNMERLGSKVLEFHNISKGFDGKILFEKFNYKFSHGEKVGIIGPNGSGKSTLLNLITNRDKPDTGKIVIGDTVQAGYFAQQGPEISPDKKVIDVVRDIAEYLPLTKGRKLTAAQLLEKFLFERNTHYQSVEKLSGGERRRLYLLTILMKNPNFLILDEPTNDLDIMTLNVLEDFLMEFKGCLLVVSHDRYFMDKVVDHLFVLGSGTLIHDYPGNYTQWRYKTDTAQTVKNAISKTAASSQKTLLPATEKKGKMSYHLKRELEQIEKELPALEKRKSEIDILFASGELPIEEINNLSGELGKLIEEIEIKTNRWLELSEEQ
jgi:ATP-binding cassette subfamily F protein uup